MGNTNDVKRIATQLIHDFLGETAGKMYEKFYSTLDEKTVLASISELLSEHLGESQANEVLQRSQLKKN